MKITYDFTHKSPWNIRRDDEEPFELIDWSNKVLLPLTDTTRRTDDEEIKIPVAYGLLQWL